VARRKITIGLTPIVASLATGQSEDPATERILSTAADLLVAYGLRRWTIDDVADRAGIGRTSVYRVFATREDLVHAVLARELHQTFAKIQAVGATRAKLEERIVESALAGLVALRGSLVEKLLESDPTTVLPFLTTGAGPLIALTRQLLVTQAQAAGMTIDDDHAAQLAEIVARLGLSFILTRETVFPIDDADALRASLHGVLGPILGPLLRTRRPLPTRLPARLESL
jgi:AcrR family transcriptional regulator